MTTTEHDCPRRAESGYQSPGPDRWDSRGSLAGGIGPSCSYCGSLNPGAFMHLVRDGWILEPTDKTYKAYVAKPLTAEEIEADRKRAMSGYVWRAVYEVTIASGKTADEATATADEHWRTHEGGVRQGRTVAKFYFQHLSEAQRTEFIELYNTRQMKVGYPGHFYSRPYFCGLAPSAATEDGR